MCTYHWYIILVYRTRKATQYTHKTIIDNLFIVIIKYNINYKFIYYKKTYKKYNKMNC